MSGAETETGISVADAAIPTIVTQRLILRPHRLDDLPACSVLWAEPEVVRFIGGVAWTREQAWGRMLRYKGSWHFLGFGFWVIEERQSGLFIGEAGFLEGRRAMLPSIEGTLEVGWVLEAVTAMVAWGRSHFPEKPMSCIIAPENRASLRVAEKLGFAPIAETIYNGSAVAVLSRNGGR